MVFLPQAQNQMFFLENLGRDGRLDLAREKQAAAGCRCRTVAAPGAIAANRRSARRRQVRDRDRGAAATLRPKAAHARSPGRRRRSRETSLRAPSNRPPFRDRQIFPATSRSDPALRPAKSPRCSDRSLFRSRWNRSRRQPPADDIFAPIVKRQFPRRRGANHALPPRWPHRGPDRNSLPAPPPPRSRSFSPRPAVLDSGYRAIALIPVASVSSWVTRSRSAFSAVASRPAAFRRGPSRKAMSSAARGERTAATSINFRRPGRFDFAISVIPRWTKMRFSCCNGTISATVPNATRSRLALKSNAGDGRILSKAWQSLKTIPTLQR